MNVCLYVCVRVRACACVCVCLCLRQYELVMNQKFYTKNGV